MFLGILVLSNVYYSYGQIREAEYECGVHGRFEYCIDGIPGCVIGCHCHPGFYFDTDTKICEPNIKLTQNFRRQYEYLEPTRAHFNPMTTPYNDELTTSKKSAVDEKIDEMTKDVDDLGDWLYNQFFKTIENQVINETKDDNIITNDKNIITRRSGSGSIILEKPSRRSHKYWKGKKKKKKKMKKKGLRSKLLRITEDDSLFDSSSGSSSIEASDSSDGSSDSSSDDSRKKKDGSDHGHKKIIMMNKRPRPPLPSFIFLPNMETQFFPPIGLPPPGLPMYPMVPVPPMMPPLYPFAGITPHSHAESEITTGASTSTDIATGGHTNGHTNSQTNDHTNVHTTTMTTETDIQVEQTENPINPTPETEVQTSPISRTQLRTRVGPRQKLMQKLREKMKRKNKLQNHFAKEYYGVEPPITQDDTVPECIPPAPNRHMQVLTQNNMGEDVQEQLSGLQDVDFKYLSQLIHKADLNKTNNILQKEAIEIPLIQNPPSRRTYYSNYPNTYEQTLNKLYSEPVNQIPKQPVYSKPNIFYHNLPYRKKIENTNDTYYTNLGRQIALMIRNIDADKELDIEIEKTNQNTPNDSVFNGNSYGSRSYWERSIRSPFKYLLNSLKAEMNHLKKSNENLYSLENQVEIAASTERTLGLRELENIISHVEKAKLRFIKKNNNENRAEVPSRTSFNVNLLPENDQSLFHGRKLNKDSNSKMYSHNHDTNVFYSNTETQLQLRPEYLSLKGQNLYNELKNIDTRRQNTFKSNLSDKIKPIYSFDSKSQDTLESPIPPASEDKESLQPSIKTYLPSPFQDKLKNNLLSNFRRLKPGAHKRSDDTIRKNIGQTLLPTRKPNNYYKPDYKFPNNYYESYTVLPLPQKLSLPQQLPIVPNMNVPLMSVTTSRTYYQQIGPMVLNQNNLNYYSGKSNPYLFEKVSEPLKFRAFAGNFDPLEGRIEPSYFHHEIHHFDYFDM